MKVKTIQKGHEGSITIIYNQYKINEQINDFFFCDLHFTTHLFLALEIAFWEILLGKILIQISQLTEKS